MKNRETRVDVAMLSTISTGNFFFDGTVANVSKSGLKMTDIPKKFDIGAQKCTTVVMGKGKRFKLVLQPCWSKEDGLYKEVGFRIVSPTVDWARFLSELNPNENDIWGHGH